ncbi:MAG: TIGR04282 family arsenosugar biosynthesis glycosyltransferase [Verrucomicrobiales bacterium]|nr:TIGR04282 family arsenosugar biosynthesis glycosyltransferase [Verrucomicrobiales bacterium]
MKRVVLVFVKFPEEGRVKTRLAGGIGGEAALLAYRQMVAGVFSRISCSEPDVIAIAFDPVEKRTAVKEWLQPCLSAFSGEVLWIPQVDGDLGSRLEAATVSVFERFPGAYLSVIGTDCVHLDASLFESTHEKLESGADVVFGPTEDGGYYLVAMKDSQPVLFRDIPWSAENTLETCISAAESAGLSVVQLPSRIDVDTEAEWKQVKGELSGHRCVFFDRDGVVNRSPGSGYVLRHEDFHLNPGIPEALAWLRRKGILAILVTSQKGVGKGLMTEADLGAIHRKMQDELRLAGGAFDAIYAYTGTIDCPHLPKPDPEMIHSAAESFFIDLRQSWMIGDADRDIEMGKAAGLAGTIRILGEKPVGTPADHTLSGTGEIIKILEKLL